MLRWALGLGCVGILLLCGALGQALEPEIKIAEPPPGTGIAEDRPPPEREGHSEAAEDDAQVQQPAIPTPGTEEAEDTESREAKERRTEEREKADLEAQRSMAESTRKMLRPAWWQVGLAGIGGVLLAISIFYVKIQPHRSAPASAHRHMAGALLHRALPVHRRPSRPPGAGAAKI